MKIPSEIEIVLKKAAEALDYKKTIFDSRTKLKRGKRAIDIEIYPKSVPRALNFFKSLLTAASKEGIPTKLCGLRYWFFLRERFFKFRLEEEYRSEWVHDRTGREKAASGILQFLLYPPVEHRSFDHRLPPTGKSWKDDEIGTLEDKIPEIVEYLPKMLDEQLAREAEQQKKYEKEREQSRLWRIEEDKRDSAKSNWKAIHRASRSWKRANELRAFIDQAKNQFGPARTIDQIAFLRMAEIVLANLDPFMEGEKPWDNIVRAIDGEKEKPFIRLRKQDYDWKIESLE